jgi:UDP-N-acetylmuramoylalanine--D-glutamate ligase
MAASALRINEMAVEVMSLQSRALVVGLGRTGFSCVEHLLQRGHAVSVADTRDQPPLLQRLREYHPGVKVTTGPLRDECFADAELVVVSPGVPVSEPVITRAAARGADVLGDVELFLRDVKAPVLAITGSNGKSTVTALVGALLAAQHVRCAVAGNIGVPVLELLAQQDSEPDCYVLELSSFQLETTTSLRARAAAILNISEDHMDRYAGLPEYIRAKSRIFEDAEVAVINRDDARLRGLVPEAVRKVSFGGGRPTRDQDYGIARIDAENWLVRGDQPLLREREVPVAGRHNVMNVLAALAVAETVTFDRQAAAAAIRRFRGLPHRMELVRERQGVIWINDSKATNVGAVIAALEGLGRPVILIAGGDGKGADFSPLRRAVAKYARHVLLIGRDAPVIAAAIGDAAAVERCRSLTQAAARAARLARPGDAVVLAPACASFDMFRDFAARGDAFRDAVRSLR